MILACLEFRDNDLAEFDNNDNNLRFSVFALFNLFPLGFYSPINDSLFGYNSSWEIYSLSRTAKSFFVPLLVGLYFKQGPGCSKAG